MGSNLTGNGSPERKRAKQTDIKKRPTKMLNKQEYLDQYFL